MRNFILILIAVFALNVVAPASTYNVKSLTEMSDKKPKHKSKKHKKSKKRSSKKRKQAKKKGLVSHGCRGLKAHPNHRR